MSNYIIPYPKYKENNKFGNSLLIDSNSGQMIISDLTMDNTGNKVVNKNLLSQGVIKEVFKAKYAPEYNRTDDYILTVISANNRERQVIISEKDFGKTEMVKQLTVQGGIMFMGSISSSKSATIIMNYVTNNLEINETFIPYYNGFQENKFIFNSSNFYLAKFDSPYFKNRLIYDENTKDIKYSVNYVFELFMKFRSINGLIILLLMLYSISFSIFSELQYELRKIVVISGEGAEKSAQILQIYNKDRPYFININSNIASIKKSIFNSKDEAIIFKGSGKHLEALHDIFCTNSTETARINGKPQLMQAQSLCAVLSNDANLYLPAGSFYEILTEEIHEDIDIVAFGNFINNTISIIEDNYAKGNFKSILDDKYSMIEDTTDILKKELAVFLTLFELAKALFAKYDLDLREMLNGKEELIYFDDFISESFSNTADASIVHKIRSRLYQAVCDCKCLLKYQSGMSIALNENHQTILYSQNSIYIYNKEFDKYISDKPNITLPRSKLIDILNNNGYLNANNGNSIRLSVHIEGNQLNRSDWIGINRDAFELDYIMPAIDDGPAINTSKFEPILLGHDYCGKEVKLPLFSHNLNNNHIGILGDSGTGKSYVSLWIINLLLHSHVPVVIVDSAESFKYEKMEPKVKEAFSDTLKYVNVKHVKLPINLFSKETMEENNFDIAQRVCQILTRACGLSEMQSNSVFSTCLKLLNNNTNMNLSILCDSLEILESDVAQKASSRIRKLADADIFIEDGTSINWEQYIEDKITIFSIEGFKDDMLKKAISETIVQDLWRYAQNNGTEDKPFMLVFDEIALTPPVKNSATWNVLNLGRKYGMSCIWNTQFFKNRFSDEVRGSLNQSSTMLYFNMSDPDEVAYVEKKLNKKGSMSFLKNKESGNCIACGDFCSATNHIYRGKALRIKIPKIVKLP